MKKVLWFVACWASAVCTLFAGGPGEAPGLPFRFVALSDLSAFRPASANWKIAGNVYADRRQPGKMEAVPGTGVLVNLSDNKNRGHLFTSWEHGDMELETEVMMARSSNSGIYFQGRYELQLLDSWGKTGAPRYSDLGGIYQRNDTITNTGYEGAAPLAHAARAPGLWQQIRVFFRAPRFDRNGAKTANACFVKVYVNGVLVQENVEVSGPTRSAAFNNERAEGPLMIQGNHGRVAFRNIGYKLYGLQKLVLSGLAVSEYGSAGDSIPAAKTRIPVNQVPTDSVSYLVPVKNEVHVLEFEGRIHFPAPGLYQFCLQTGGSGMLVIGGDTVIRHDGVHDFGEVVAGSFRAAAGAATFRLIYNRLIPWRKGLALYAEGPGIPRHPLHAPGSVFVEPFVEPIRIHVTGTKASIQRSFMGEGKDKRTHCLSVGTGKGVHFSVDLARGSLFQGWSGDFLDATGMWNRRGNRQTAVPLGEVLVVGNDLDVRAGTGPAHPRFLGYDLDAEGIPVFSYALGAGVISDHITPSTEERGLVRKLALESGSVRALCIAASRRIELLPDGSYAIADKQYYLSLLTPGLKPYIRKTASGAQLLVSFNASGRREIRYQVVW